MNKLGLSLGLALAVIGPTAGNATPVQWTTASGGNGHWYEIVNASVDWYTAVSNAASSTFGASTGYLATITSAEEWAFFESVNVSRTYYWLGGSDLANEGTWLWVTEPGGAIAFSFSDWYPGEPNDLYDEDFLQVGGLWNDIYPSWTGGYVVEYSGNPSAVPLPATLPLLVAGLGALGFGLRRRKQA